MSETDLIALVYEAFSDLNLDNYLIPLEISKTISQFIDEFCDEPTVKEKITKGVKQILSDVTLCGIAQNACTQGYIDSDNKQSILKTSFAVSLYAFFIQLLQFYIASIPIHTDDMRVKISGLVTGSVQDEDFFQSGVSLIRVINPLSLIGRMCDKLSSTYADVLNFPPIGPDTIMIAGMVSNLVTASDSIRTALIAGKNVRPAQSTFTQLNNALIRLVPQYVSVFGDIRVKLQDRFTSFYKHDQYYTNFTALLNSICSSFMGIWGLCIETGMNVANGSEELIHPLSEISNQFMELVVLSHKLMKFHCNVLDVTARVKNIGDNMLHLFRPVLSSLGDCIEKGSRGFQSAINTQLTSLFKEFAKLHNDFSAALDKLLTTLKLDGQYKVFSTVTIENYFKGYTNVSAKRPCRTLMKIGKGLLVAKASFPNLIAWVRALIIDYQDYLGSFTTKVQNEPYFQKRITIMHKSDEIQRSMTAFTKEMGELGNDSSNALMKLSSGLAAIDIVLSISALETSTYTFQVLDESLEIVVNLCTTFFPDNQGIISYIVDRMNKSKARLPESVRHRIMNSIDFLSRHLENAITVFMLYGDRKPQSLVKTMMAYSRLAVRLKCLAECMRCPEVAGVYDDIAAVSIKLSDAFSRLVWVFSRILQIYLYHLCLTLATLSGKILENMDIVLPDLKRIQHETRQKYQVVVKELNKLLEEADVKICYDFTWFMKLAESVKKFLPIVNDLSSSLKKCAENTHYAAQAKQSLSSIETAMVKIQTIFLYEEFFSVFNTEHVIEQAMIGPIFNNMLFDISGKSAMFVHSFSSNAAQASLQGYILCMAFTELLKIVRQTPRARNWGDVISDTMIVIFKASSAFSLGDALYQKQAIDALSRYVSITNEMKLYAQSEIARISTPDLIEALPDTTINLDFAGYAPSLESLSPIPDLGLEKPNGLLTSTLPIPEQMPSVQANEFRMRGPSLLQFNAGGETYIPDEEGFDLTPMPVPLAQRQSDVPSVLEMALFSVDPAANDVPDEPATPVVDEPKSRFDENGLPVSFRTVKEDVIILKNLIERLIKAQDASVSKDRMTEMAQKIEDDLVILRCDVQDACG